MSDDEPKTRFRLASSGEILTLTVEGWDGDGALQTASLQLWPEEIQVVVHLLKNAAFQVKRGGKADAEITWPGPLDGWLTR